MYTATEEVQDDSLAIAVHRTLKEMRDEFRKMGRTETALVLFWLAGPFVYLIESAPADIWLVTIGLAFIVRSIACHDWSWISTGWVRAVSVFVVACLVSSALSDSPLHAVGKTIAWIRFPLYAAAAAFWLATTPARQRAILTACATGALVLCGILLVELLMEPGKSRLYGLYGDPKPGGYLAKMTMPVVAVLVIVSASMPIRRGLFVLSLPFAIFLFTVCTGERVHTALVGLALCLAVLVTGIRIRRIVVLAVIGIVALFALTQLHPSIKDRFIGDSKTTIYDFFSSPYWRAMRPGVIGFFQNPITGIGVHMHETICPDLPEQRHRLPGSTQCLNHVHQHYVQLAEETGIVGLLSGIVMILTIIHTCWKARVVAPWSENRSLRRAAWITPVVLFFPQFNADFFGQWNNLFVWFALGLALAMAKTIQVRVVTLQRE